METSIVWAVVWGILFFVGPTIIVIASTLVFGSVAYARAKGQSSFDRETSAVGGMVGGQLIGYALAIGFMVLAAVQCVLMIINAVNGV